MTEPEDPEVVAMRERADRVMAKRASKRAEAAAEEEAAPKKKKKGGKRWYEWVFDIALFAVAGYFIKTRFFDKQPEPPAPPAASAHASASAVPSVVTRSSAPMRAAPAASDGVVDTLPPNTAVEVLELSPTGFVKVKTASGKEGWVAAGDVVTK